MNNVRDELSSFQRRADRIDLAPRNRARPGAASGRHASDAEVPLPMMFSDDEEAYVGKTRLPRIPSAIQA